MEMTNDYLKCPKDNHIFKVQEGCKVCRGWEYRTIYHFQLSPDMNDIKGCEWPGCHGLVDRRLGWSGSKRKRWCSERCARREENRKRAVRHRINLLKHAKI